MPVVLHFDLKLPGFSGSLYFIMPVTENLICKKGDSLILQKNKFIAKPTYFFYINKEE